MRKPATSPAVPIYQNEEEHVDLVVRDETVLMVAGAVADQTAAQYAFERFKQGLATHTLTRHRGDLALFQKYLTAASITTGDLFTDPWAWRGMSWGLVEGFVAWMLHEGYAIGSISVRLSTVKVYAKQALRAGVINQEAYTLIQTVKSYGGSAGRNIDAQRSTTRRSTKKEEPLTISREQALRLKRKQPHTPQGRRDALLMCLLLDHGLRESEIAALRVEHIDLERRTMRFYRRKVHKTQVHVLSDDTYHAALAYLRRDARPRGLLLRGSVRTGDMHDYPREKQDAPLAQGMTISAIKQRVQFLGEVVGLLHLSPHDCRHYWATKAVRNGNDVKTLQEAGGWSSPSMPLKYAQAGAIANEGLDVAD